jgi:hypothetical protein
VTLTTPKNDRLTGARGGTRTPGAHLRTVALYPLSYAGNTNVNFRIDPSTETSGGQNPHQTIAYIESFMSNVCTYTFELNTDRCRVYVATTILDESTVKLTVPAMLSRVTTCSGFDGAMTGNPRLMVREWLDLLFVAQ